MKQKNNFYIITGGPCAGKTTLLEELKIRGYYCVEEVARKIIQQEMIRNGNALPWADSTAYSTLMLEHSVADFKGNSEKETTVFFDRGIPDTYAYKRLIGLSIETDLLEAIKNYRYNKLVFLLPFWQEIYETDNERKQDADEAKRTYETIKQAYSELGYETKEIPRMDVKARTDFLLDILDEKSRLIR